MVSGLAGIVNEYLYSFAPESFFHWACFECGGMSGPTSRNCVHCHVRWILLPAATPSLMLRSQRSRDLHSMITWDSALSRKLTLD
jgi:hypothetical protein